MGVTVQSVLEPLVILATFVVGLCANCRHRLDFRGETSPHLSNTEISLLRRHTSATDRIPTDSRPFRDNFASKFLARFPFAMEIFYWIFAYWPYQLFGGALITVSAQSRASSIIALEEKLGIAFELPLQRYLLRCTPLIMTLLGDVYFLHISVGVAFLVYGYSYFPPSRYQTIRRALALNNALAFLLISLWRYAPPRLMPPRLGFIDILHPPPGYAGETSAWANNHSQLSLAAMPSLHVGTALLIGASVALWGRHKWLRVLAPLYPMLMAVAVLATANDWVLDCVAGLCVVALGLYFNRVLLLLRPLEEWAFWICRVERPRDRVDHDDLRKAWEV